MGRQLRLIGISVLMLVVIAPATAFGAEGEILPGTAGTSLTGKSAKTTLQIKGGASITCASSETTGEITSTTHGSGTTTLKSCTSSGLPVNSVGAGAGTISWPWLYLFCLYVLGREHDFCVRYFWDAPRLLEVPSTKLTIQLQGGFISEVAPTGTKAETFTLGTTQKAGKQSIEETEGGETAKIEASTDGSAFVQAGIELKESTISFGISEEIM